MVPPASIREVVSYSQASAPRDGVLSIDQARLETVYRVMINRDPEQPYAVLQLYFGGQLRTFDEMTCFQQPWEV